MTEKTDNMVPSRDQILCPGCGGPGKTRNYRVDDYDLYRCRNCSTEFLVLRPGGKAFEKTYWDAYKFEGYSNPAALADYSARYAEIFTEARKYAPRMNTVLDVGCGIGNFLAWAADPESIGPKSPVGAEVDTPAVDEARSRGFEVHYISELQSKCEPESFDVLTMWDVIEHLEDPSAAVGGVIDLLRQDGLMILETPDVKFPLRPLSIALRKVAEPIRYSDILYFAGHRTYFSAEGLAALLEPHGLEVMTTMRMRSPSGKMSNLFSNMDGGASGRSLAKLYKPLEASMKATGLSNKLIMILRKT